VRYPKLNTGHQMMPGGGFLYPITESRVGLISPNRHSGTLKVKSPEVKCHCHQAFMHDFCGLSSAKKAVDFTRT